MAIVSRGGRVIDPGAGQQDYLSTASAAVGQAAQIGQQRRQSQLATLQTQVDALLQTHGGLAFEVAPDLMNQWAQLAGVDPREVAAQTGWTPQQEMNFAQWQATQQATRPQEGASPAEVPPSGVPAGGVAAANANLMDVINRLPTSVDPASLQVSAQTPTPTPPPVTPTEVAGATTIIPGAFATSAATTTSDGQSPWPAASRPMGPSVGGLTNDLQTLTAELLNPRSETTAQLQADPTAFLSRSDVQMLNQVSGGKVSDAIAATNTALLGARGDRRQQEQIRRNLAVALREIAGEAGLQGAAVQEMATTARQSAITPQMRGVVPAEGPTTETLYDPGQGQTLHGSGMSGSYETATMSGAGPLESAVAPQVAITFRPGMTVENVAAAIQAQEGIPNEDKTRLLQSLYGMAGQDGGVVTELVRDAFQQEVAAVNEDLQRRLGPTPPLLTSTDILNQVGSDQLPLGQLMTTEFAQTLEAVNRRLHGRLAGAVSRGNIEEVRQLLTASANQSDIRQTNGLVARGAVQSAAGTGQNIGFQGGTTAAGDRLAVTSGDVATGQTGGTPTSTTPVSSPLELAQEVANSLPATGGSLAQRASVALRSLSPEASQLLLQLGGTEFRKQYGDQQFDTPYGPRSGMELDWYRQGAFAQGQLREAAGGDPTATYDFSNMVTDDGQLVLWGAQNGETIPAATATAAVEPPTGGGEQDVVEAESPFGGLAGQQLVHSMGVEPFGGTAAQQLVHSLGVADSPVAERQVQQVASSISDWSQQLARNVTTRLAQVRDLPTEARQAALNQVTPTPVQQATAIRRAAGQPLQWTPESTDRALDTLYELRELYPEMFPQTTEAMQNIAMNDAEIEAQRMENALTGVLFGSNGQVLDDVATALQEEPILQNGLVLAQTRNLVIQAEVMALQAMADQTVGREYDPAELRQVHDDIAQIEADIAEATTTMTGADLYRTLSMHANRLNAMQELLPPEMRILYTVSEGRLRRIPIRGLINPANRRYAEQPSFEATPLATLTDTPTSEDDTMADSFIDSFTTTGGN